MNISDIIRQELRMAGLFHERQPSLPLPADLDAEAELCSSVLNEYVKPERFPELKAREFYSVLHQHVWVACDAVISAGYRVSDKSVLACLEASGFKGPRLEDELATLRNAQPFVALKGLDERAERVRELYRQRQLIALMAELDADLRLGRLSHEAARDRLRQYFLGGLRPVRAA